MSWHSSCARGTISYYLRWMRYRVKGSMGIMLWVVGLVVLAALYIPGFLLVRGCGASRVTAVLCAPMVMVGLYVLVGMGLQQAGVFATGPAMLGCGLALAAAVYGIGRMARRGSRRNSFRAVALPCEASAAEVAGRAEESAWRLVWMLRRGGDWSLLVFYLVLGVSVTAFMAASCLTSPESIVQEYDNVHHLGVAQAFLQSGVWSPFAANLYSAPDAAAFNPLPLGGFYPTAWSMLVAFAASLTGCGVPVAANALNCAIAGAIYPTSLFFLIRVDLPGPAWRPGRWVRSDVGFDAVSLGAHDFRAVVPQHAGLRSHARGGRLLHLLAWSRAHLRGRGRGRCCPLPARASGRPRPMVPAHAGRCGDVCVLPAQRRVLPGRVSGALHRGEGLRPWEAPRGVSSCWLALGAGGLRADRWRVAGGVQRAHDPGGRKLHVGCHEDASPGPARSWPAYVSLLVPQRAAGPVRVGRHRLHRQAPSLAVGRLLLRAALCAVRGGPDHRRPREGAAHRLLVYRLPATGRRSGYLRDAPCGPGSRGGHPMDCEPAGPADGLAAETLGWLVESFGVFASSFASRCSPRGCRLGSVGGVPRSRASAFPSP